MSRVLFVLALVVVGLAGLGYYLGWYEFTSDSADGKGYIGVTVDKDKFHEDEKKAQEKLHDLGNHLKGKATTPAEKSKEPSGLNGPLPQD